MKIGIDCRMLGNKFTGIGLFENLVKNLNELDSKINMYFLKTLKTQSNLN